MDFLERIMEIEKQKRFDSVFDEYAISLGLNGYVVTDESWYQSEIQCPYSRLYYVIDGSGSFVYGGREMKIEPGYVYFAPCGASYGFYGTPAVEKLFFHINITKPDGYDLFASPDMRIARFKCDTEQIKRLLALYRSDDPVKLLLLKAEIWKTVMEFASEMLIFDSTRKQYSETVEAAILYIRENISASLKSSCVADAVFCSVSSLTERFKKEMGTSVAKYIDDMLMFEACKMLASDNKTIGEISTALGYCDQFYFSRRFAKRFSITPRDYRKRCAES